MTTGGLDPDPPDPGARVDVEAIRKRADAATPGPWKSGYAGNSAHRMTTPRGEVSCPTRADADFIAGARADVPVLCDALEHERRVSALWKALAQSRSTRGIPMLDAGLEIRRRQLAGDAALAALRALGIDPEAP